MRQLTEGVGIAFEGDEVAPLLWFYKLFQLLAFSVLEETADGVLARVAERRIAEVVGQTSRSHDGLDVGLTFFQLVMLVCQLFNSSAGDGASYAGHFEAVGQAVVDHLCARQRKHLSLVLQSAEGATEDDAVVVALKRAADVGALVRLRVTLVGE